MTTIIKSANIKAIQQNIVDLLHSTLSIVAFFSLVRNGLPSNFGLLITTRTGFNLPGFLLTG